MTAALAWLGVAVFGGLGALTRFRVDDAVTRRWPGAFPRGTLVVNGSGSFVLGILVGAALSSRLMLVLGTGFVGGYTTFSTWMVETERLAEDGESLLFWGNLAGSMVLGVACAGLGWVLGASV